MPRDEEMPTRRFSFGDSEGLLPGDTDWVVELLRPATWVGRDHLGNERHHSVYVVRLSPSLTYKGEKRKYGILYPYFKGSSFDKIDRWPFPVAFSPFLGSDEEAQTLAVIPSEKLGAGTKGAVDQVEKKT